MKRHIWTTIAITLALITLASGLNSLSENLLSGQVMLLLAVACRSANKRRFNEVNETKLRFLMEYFLVASAVLLVVLQNRLIDRIATEPFANVVIPVVSITFYIIAYVKASKSKEAISEGTTE